MPCQANNPNVAKVTSGQNLQSLKNRNLKRAPIRKPVIKRRKK
jgi:hypothetical protein